MRPTKFFTLIAPWLSLLVGAAIILAGLISGAPTKNVTALFGVIVIVMSLIVIAISQSSQ